MADILNREITVKGEFNRAVIVNDTFVNGKNCVYVDSHNTFSHAEGYMSNASGMYSHADGIRAHSLHDHSYVWSGLPLASSSTPCVSSNGIGTFSVYTSGYSDTEVCSSNGLKEMFVNKTRLFDIFTHYKDLAVDEIRNSDNVFTKNLYLSGDGSSDEIKSFVISRTNSMNVSGDSIFDGNVTFTNNSTVIANTQDTRKYDGTIATCKFVHDVVRSYFKNILGEGVLNSI